MDRVVVLEGLPVGLQKYFLVDDEVTIHSL